MTIPTPGTVTRKPRSASTRCALAAVSRAMPNRSASCWRDGAGLPGSPLADPDFRFDEVSNYAAANDGHQKRQAACMWTRDRELRSVFSVQVCVDVIVAF